MIRFTIWFTLGHSRLELSLRDGLDARAHHLGHIGSGVYAQCNDTCRQDSDTVTGKSQRIVEETQLKQNRCILHDLHIDSADDLQYLFSAGSHQAKDHTQGQR